MRTAWRPGAGGRLAWLVPQLAAVVLPGTVGALLILVWVLSRGRLPARFCAQFPATGLAQRLRGTPAR